MFILTQYFHSKKTILSIFIVKFIYKNLIIMSKLKFTFHHISFIISEKKLTQRKLYKTDRVEIDLINFIPVIFHLNMKHDVARQKKLQKIKSKL